MPHNAPSPTDSRAQRNRSEVTRFATRTFFEQILRSSACALIVVDTVDRSQPVVYVSPAFCRLMGHSEAELLGRSWSSLLDLDGSETMPDLSGTTRPADQETHATLNIRDKRGNTLCLEARMTALHGALGVSHCTIVFHDVTAASREREALAYEAHHDPLTGLANRRLFRERFEQAAAHAQRRGASFSIVLIDLDRFKMINDRYGHHVGDEVLKYISRQLKEAVRAEDTVARVGGDEFALLLMDSGAPIPSLMGRIDVVLSDGLLLQDERLTISCGVGIAKFPSDGTDLLTLLRAADLRLYTHKRSSDGRSQDDQRGISDHSAVPE